MSAVVVLASCLSFPIVNRWLAVRFNLLSSTIIGAMALVCLITPGIDASLAGFALTFASTVTNDLLSLVRQFVGLEQSMVWCEILHHSMMRCNHCDLLGCFGTCQRIFRAEERAPGIH